MRCSIITAPSPSRASGEGLCLHLAFSRCRRAGGRRSLTGAVRRGSRPGRRLASADVAPSPRAERRHAPAALALERRHARFGPRPRLRFDIRSEWRVGIPRSAFSFRHPLSRICSNLVKVGVVKTFQRRWFAYTNPRPCFRHIFAMDRRFILRELKIAGGMEIRVR